jgi:hypothetical protein
MRRPMRQPTDTSAMVTSMKMSFHRYTIAQDNVARDGSDDKTTVQPPPSAFPIISNGIAH